MSKTVKLLNPTAREIADWLTRVVPRGQDEAERIHRTILYLHKAARSDDQP